MYVCVQGTVSCELSGFACSPFIIWLLSKPNNKLVLSECADMAIAAELPYLYCWDALYAALVHC